MEAFPQFTMATSNSNPNPKLLTMPPEIMLMITPSTDTFQSKVNLARTCSSMYDTLINSIYRQASKSKSLARAHIYEACRDGNILTLERSFQAEALSISRIDHRVQERFNRPLYTAIQFYQVHVVQWLLARGADPNFVGDREVSMPMLFDSPLQVAVQSVVMPGLPEWCIPEKWYRMGFVRPCHHYLRWAGRVIVRLLREAGADDKSLFLRLDREHLDWIESGTQCCRLHPVC